MSLRPRHTTIVETIETGLGTLVREDYYQYSKNESNLYLVNSFGEIVWFAERAMDDDAYANPIRIIGEDRIKCASWNGFDCELFLRDGKLGNVSFTK
jgi:hypothetical protein